MKQVRNRESSLPVPTFSSGYTLVELLVGVTLGLFIVGVSLTYMVSTSRTLRVQSNESVAQENARFAMEVISQNIRLAGLNQRNDFNNDVSLVLDVAVCANGEGGLADAAIGNQVCANDGANDAVENNSDRFAIDYAVDATDETADLNVTGCNGSAIAVPFGSAYRLASVFWTADLDADGVRSLYCQTINITTNAAVGVAQPLVDGVDRIQVQYGVNLIGDTDLNDSFDTDTDGDGDIDIDIDGDGTIDPELDFDDRTDGVVERYLPASSITAAQVPTIKAIRFSILVSSGFANANEQATEESVNRSYVYRFSTA